MQRVWFNKTFSSVGAAIALIRQADVAGDYVVLCSNTNPHATAFLAAHEWAVEPSGLHGAAYLAWCLEFCRTREIGIFIPGKEAALIGAACAEFEAQGTRVLSVATPEVLHLLHDKARFYQTVACATPPAAFEVVENAEQFDAAYRALRQQHAQLCLKPSASVYGLGFSVIDEVRSSAQLLLEGAAYQIGLDDLRRGLSAMGTFRTMLVMQYLPGHEYSVDCVGEHGRLVCAVARKKPLLAGPGQTIDQRADLLESTRQLTAAYGLNGVFNVQFREDAAGALALLEINPRMSGGIGMACLAGPNLPYLALAGFDRGFADVPVAPIRCGLRVGELTHATELP